MADIHSSASVAAGAQLGAGVRIGPGAVIEDSVSIGDGTEIGPHAVVRAYTRIGRNNRIDAHAVIGGRPQHTAWDGAETWVEIGDDNDIREFVTINRAFVAGATTRIGSGCLLMAYAHVGHDCTVGDRVILTNAAQLGGHVDVGRNAVFGGHSGAHQFTRIGAYCMVGAQTVLRKDALPFTLIGGEPVRHYRLNRVGLRRNGFDRDRYRAVEAAFRRLRDGDRSLDGVPATDDIHYLRTWLEADSRFGIYGFATGRRGGNS